MSKFLTVITAATFAAVSAFATSHAIAQTKDEKKAATKTEAKKAAPKKAAPKKAAPKKAAPTTAAPKPAEKK